MTRLTRETQKQEKIHLLLAQTPIFIRPVSFRVTSLCFRCMKTRSDGPATGLCWAVQRREMIDWPVACVGVHWNSTWRTDVSLVMDSKKWWPGLSLVLVCVKTRCDGRVSFVFLYIETHHDELAWTVVCAGMHGDLKWWIEEWRKVTKSDGVICRLSWPAGRLKSDGVICRLCWGAWRPKEMRLICRLVRMHGDSKCWTDLWFVLGTREFKIMDWFFTCGGVHGGSKLCLDLSLVLERMKAQKDWKESRCVGLHTDFKWWDGLNCHLGLGSWSH